MKTVKKLKKDRPTRLLVYEKKKWKQVPYVLQQ